MGDTIVIETPVATVLEVSGLQGPQGVPGATGATGATGPQGPAGTGIETLTTKGDLLSRNDSAAIRVGIGSTGQVLKVASTGLPAWENESGGVPTSRTITAGTGLTGGGDLTANRTLSVSYGSSNPAALGTASAGSSNDVARADHVHSAEVSDSAFRVTGSTDSTKKLAIEVDTNVPANTTVTLTAPSASGTIALAGAAPAAHAGSHASAGSDPLFDQDLNSTDDVAFNEVSIAASGRLFFGDAATFEADGELYLSAPNGILAKDSEFLITGSTATTKKLRFEADTNIPADTTVVLTSPASSGTIALSGDAPASHTHGNLTNDGKLGSTAGLPVVTTTSGAVTTLALGTANQVLRVNSGASGVEFADPAASGVTGAAASASDVLGVSGANITGVDANADRIIFWDDSASALKHLTVGSGLSLTDTTLTATGGGVTTGSVDNAIIRADGTGGSTSQSSDINIEDATTSTANNVTISNQHSGQTNSSLVLQPKGTGAFILGEKPAATSSSGNARGASAVDLQLIRTNAARVASGLRSALLGGANNTASGQDAVVIGGTDNTASGFQSIVLGGRNNTASSDRSVAIADGNTSSATNSIAMGAGNTASASQSLAICNQSRADRLNMLAHGSGSFATAGDAQRIRAVLRCKTTTNAAVEMALDGSATYLTIPSGKVIFCNIKVVGVKSDGSVVATYERQYAAKNVAGTSSQVYAAVTIGTDNAASTSLEIATVDAGDYIRIRPTGIASETWRWVASVDAVEVAYGT